MQWRTLWTVSTVTQNLLNERAAGIVSLGFATNNPIQLNQYFTNSLFSLHVSAITTLQLVSVRVYGADDVNGFPPPATPAEALWQYDQVPVLAANQGILRLPMAKRQDGAPAGGAADQVFLLPNFLLLEYSTGAGASATLTFVIEMGAVGDVPDLNE